ncbi:MAG TPA: hypothetical protein VNM91_03795 [Dehalococcoidia bacterium]|nr:hypothetical protein [Dehalococcoidia bacterium]
MQTIEGIIAAINDRGLRLEGDELWHNFTRAEWRGRWDPVSKGDKVRLTLANDFVKAIELLDRPESFLAPSNRAAERPRRAEDRRSIERQVALKAAVELARPLAELVARRLEAEEKPHVGEAITALASHIVAAADMFAAFLAEGEEQP